MATINYLHVEIEAAAHICPAFTPMAARGKHFALNSICVTWVCPCPKMSIHSGKKAPDGGSRGQMLQLCSSTAFQISRVYKSCYDFHSCAGSLDFYVSSSTSGRACFLTSQRLPPLALHLSASSWRWMDHLLA